MDLVAKKNSENISKLFDNISAKYDFLNHFLSLNIDKRWRKKLINLLYQDKAVNSVLDVATGTGDLAIAALIRNPNVKITGIDVSSKMMELGTEKVSRLKMDDKIKFIQCPAEKIPFPENSFDAVMVAFGVRNFENLEQGISEMRRVLKPSGNMYILEFSKPHGFLKPIYFFYFKYVLPLLGRIISKDKIAYKYLFESVENFPDSNDFAAFLFRNKMLNVRKIRLNGGIATIYVGGKN